MRNAAKTAAAPVVVLVTVALAGATPAAAQTGTVRGQVTDAATGEAIPIARVSVEGTRIRARTSQDGRYTLSGIPPGNVVVVAELLGYEPERREVTVARGRARTVNFRLGHSAPEMAERIMRSAGISGVVLEARVPPEPGRVRAAAAAPLRALHPPAPRDFNTESYAHIAENDFRLVSASPLSTFSIDVDGASYANVRRFIQDGERPPADAVRIEEMINYFPYEWDAVGGEHPFSVTTEVWDAPWKRDHRLVRVGLHARSIDTEDLPPGNLVFLLDVSGSMESDDKLPLLKKAFALLVDQLRPRDRVAIVVYAGAAGMVLPSTPGNRRERILAALDKLRAGGGTAGGAGLELAYATAFEHFIEDGNNRIILATDGDFNVGASSDAEMVRLIEQERDGGIFLTVMGFGTGNLKDSKMEQIADHGNGNFHYVDGLLEARKVLVEEMGGTLFTLAKDVKLQIEFNPARVAGYRLIGYENRLLADEDFNDDTKDAGELGAGHTVTALYEVVPVGVAVPREEVDDLRYQPRPDDLPPSAFEGEMMYVKVRYKDPDGTRSKLLEKAVADRSGPPSVEFRFATAVAGFGMLLRDSKHVGDLTLGDVVGLAEKGKGSDPRGYRGEFIRLVEAARDLGLLKGKTDGMR